MSKVFLSIGAGPGIGLQTAIRFAKEGFTPVLAARTITNLEPLADEVRRVSGQAVETVALDAADSSQLALLGERFREHVHVLHYNAAILRPQHFYEATLESLDNDIRVDLTGALASIKIFAPQMINRKSGTILLTGGGLALTPSNEFLTLSVGKAGIRCMSQALFQELAEHNVHIASLTIAKQVDAAAGDPLKIAEIFWNIHAQQREAWTWEEYFS